MLHWWDPYEAMAARCKTEDGYDMKVVRELAEHMLDQGYSYQDPGSGSGGGDPKDLGLPEDILSLVLDEQNKIVSERMYESEDEEEEE